MLNTVTRWPSNLTPRYIVKKFKLHTHKNLDTNVNNSITHKTPKQFKCLSTDEQVNKMWHIHIMEYYLAMKMSRRGEFPGGLGVRILGFHCCGQASVPGQGTESQAENKQEGVGRWHLLQCGWTLTTLKPVTEDHKSSWFTLGEIPKIGQFIEAESRWVVV